MVVVGKRRGYPLLVFFFKAHATTRGNQGPWCPPCAFFYNTSCSKREKGGRDGLIMCLFFATLAIVLQKMGAKCSPLCFFIARVATIKKKGGMGWPLPPCVFFFSTLL
jgi:hypothetical protein